MTPRERVFAALEHRPTDCVPRFEIWIDASLQELGQADPASAYVKLGQDCVMMPTCNPPESNAWRDGVDEWGRVWSSGMYVDGVVAREADLARYSPASDDVERFYVRGRIQ